MRAGTDVCDRFRAAREKSGAGFSTRFAQFKDRAVIEGQTLGVQSTHQVTSLCSVITGNGCPFCDPVIGTGYGAKTGADAVTTGSDIWQKEYALELQRRRLTRTILNWSCKKRRKRRRRRSVFAF